MLNASLYLSSVASGFGLMYPAELVVSPYFDIFKKMDSNIKKMFDITLESLEESDTEKANTILEMHVTTKELHAEIISMLNKGEGINIQTAIVYALVTEYFRRVSAHLQNIASTVVQPYDRVGFDKEKPPSQS